ncbi:MAG: DUF2510 domain-containing protein [Gaiellaceae bacterium]
MLIFASSTGVVFVVLLLIGLIWAAIGARMANSRGRNPTVWGIVCFLFALFGVIALAVAGKTEDKKREDVQKYLLPSLTAAAVTGGEWRPDPSGRHEYRYWDGATWSDSVADHGEPSIDPMAPAAAAVGEWRVDPSGRHEYRFWNGSEWLENVSDHGQSAIDPLTRAEPQHEERSVAAGTKICPDCAEEIKAAALVCRFCGHHFEPATEAREPVGAGAGRS